MHSKVNMFICYLHAVRYPNFFPKPDSSYSLKLLQSLFSHPVARPSTGPEPTRG